MANSVYGIKEIRILDHEGGKVDVYFRLTNANDFMPIAGWYKKTVPDTLATLDFIGKALMTQEYLMASEGWTREEPPGETRSQAVDHLIKQLRMLHSDNLMDPSFDPRVEGLVAALNAMR